MRGILVCQRHRQVAHPSKGGERKLADEGNTIWWSQVAHHIPGKRSRRREVLGSAKLLALSEANS